MLISEVEGARLIVTEDNMAQTRLSKEKVINLARQHASLAALNSSTMQQAEEMYELLKDSMLEERPWPFALGLARGLQATDQGEDLNYRFKYRLPSDAVNVIAINSTKPYGIPSAASNYDLIRIGIAPIDDQPVGTLGSATDFFVKAGLLHTNTEVSDILYVKTPAEKDFSTDFTLALSWALAKYFAITVSNNGELAAYCEREMGRHHTRALRGLNKQFPSIEKKVLYSWLKQYYGALYT